MSTYPTLLDQYSGSLVSYYSLVAPLKFPTEHSALTPPSPLTLKEYTSQRCTNIVKRYLVETNSGEVVDGSDRLGRDLMGVYDIVWDRGIGKMGRGGEQNQ